MILPGFRRITPSFETGMKIDTFGDFCFSTSCDCSYGGALEVKYASDPFVSFHLPCAPGTLKL